eukprot:scaffold647913_cov40-Prasinocladus_malaysianus.AAC.1
MLDSDTKIACGQQGDSSASGLRKRKFLDKFVLLSAGCLSATHTACTLTQELHRPGQADSRSYCLGNLQSSVSPTPGLIVGFVSLISDQARAYLTEYNCD